MQRLLLPIAVAVNKVVTLHHYISHSIVFSCRWVRMYVLQLMQEFQHSVNNPQFIYGPDCPTPLNGRTRSLLGNAWGDGMLCRCVALSTTNALIDK
jgi:hypothetical protein